MSASNSEPPSSSPRCRAGRDHGDPAVLKVAQAEPQLSRTYYQDGRLLTAVDLNRDYAYLDRRLLDLGLALGDGVVQGLDASLTDTRHQRHAGPRDRAERPRRSPTAPPTRQSR